MKPFRVMLGMTVALFALAPCAHASWHLKVRSINTTNYWSWNSPGYWVYETGKIRAIGGLAHGDVAARSQWPTTASVNLTGAGFQLECWEHRTPSNYGEVELNKSVVASGEVEIRNGPSSAGAHGNALSRHKFDEDAWDELRAELSVARATSEVTWANIAVPISVFIVTVAVTLPLTYTTGMGYSNQAPTLQQATAGKCPVRQVQWRIQAALDLTAWADSDLLQLLTSTARASGHANATMQATLLERDQCL